MSLSTTSETDFRPPGDLLSRPEKPTIRGQTSTRTEAGLKPFGDDGFSFFDLLDIVNPLQHIPVVSAIYREITGDTLDPLPRVAGGALFGGVIGFAAAAVNAIIDGTTGKDVGGHVLAFLGDRLSPDNTEATRAVADSENATPAKETWLGVTPVTVEALPTIARGNAPGPRIASSARSPEPEDRATRPSGVPGPKGGAPSAPTGRPPASAAAPPDPAQRKPATERFRPAQVSAKEDEAGLSPPPDDPAGTIAADGGWFTQVMLQALEKYQAGAQLGQEGSRRVPTISIVQ